MFGIKMATNGNVYSTRLTNLVKKDDIFECEKVTGYKGGGGGGG